MRTWAGLAVPAVVGVYLAEPKFAAAALVLAFCAYLVYVATR